MIQTINPEQLYGTSEAARLMGCTRQNVWLQCSLGRIEHTKIGNGSCLITGRAILAYLAKVGKAPTPAQVLANGA